MSRKIGYILLVVLLIIGAWMFTSEIELGTETMGTKVNLNYRAEQQFQPEIALISLGVETKKSSVDKAMEENNRQMQKVISSLKELKGLTIDTTSFQLSPVTEQDQDKQIIYYRVINQIKVKTSRMDKIGTIIKNAVTSGANRVLSIEYSLENPEENRRKVIEKGIKGINDKAEFIARQMDKTVFETVSLNVNDQFINNLNQDFGYKVTRAGPEETGTLPPISPGKIKISVNVRATFSIH